ncbi:MAG: DUF1559 domain-containing protein [Planctomycetia bacterium]|nr:DUF1559 domain-containing protein [Planctomycetia bacterium]
MSHSHDTPGAAAPFAGPRFRLWHLFALTAWASIGAAMFHYWDGTLAAGVFSLGTLALAALVWRSSWLFAASIAWVFLLFLFLPALDVDRGPGRRAQCLNNLKNITLALQNYESAHGAFPPAVTFDKHGKPMHSWRVYILPQLDRNDLYKRYRFDEPWNGPNNSQLLSEHMGIFYCPSDVRGTDDFHTSYVAVVGDHTVWPEKKSIGYETVRQLDGAERTLLLIETHNSGIHWMEPRDVTLADCINGTHGPRAGSLPGGNCNHPSCSVVSFVDGHISVLPDTVTATELKELLTIDDEAPTETNFEWAP